MSKYVCEPVRAARSCGIARVGTCAVGAPGLDEVGQRPPRSLCGRLAVPIKPDDHQVERPYLTCLDCLPVLRCSVWPSAA